LRELFAVLAAWLCLPFALLATAVAALCAVYAIGLGHLPDWSCYLDYCRNASAFALPMNPRGTVAVLLIAYLAIVTAGAYCLRGSNPLWHLPLLVGAGTTLWAVSSYYVGRSAEEQGAN